MDVSTEDLAAIKDLLQHESTLTLATTGDDGLPRAAALFYLADDDLQLYWFSSTSSEHSRDAALIPDAAVTIHHPTERWQEIRGVQMRGAVEVVHLRALRKRITTAYVERFQLGTIFRAAITRSSLYVFRPAWIRYIDNAKGFGYKVEFRPLDRAGTDSSL